MAKYKHLTRAPIKEAVIDIRAQTSRSVSEASARRFQGKLGDRYPEFTPIRLFQGRIGLDEGKPSQTVLDEGIVGYSFKSSDGTQIAQFKNDGFTFSRLHPYTTWKEVISEAKDLWAYYIAEHGEDGVVRLAVRYINQLTIKLPIPDFREYLTTPPQVPSGAPNDVSSFVTRVVTYDAKEDIRAILAQSMETETIPGVASVILDNDVFKLVEFKSGQHQLWEVFESLARLKNQIFFGSITEKTVEMYE